MRKISIFLLSTLLFISCNKKTNDAANDAPEKMTEDFAQFNKHFHSDSLFQMSRIVFPLEGKYTDGGKTMEWTKSRWEMLKAPVGEKIADNSYKQQTTYSDTLVTEKVYIENSGFSFERKFRIINGKWFLVYCNDVNL